MDGEVVRREAARVVLVDQHERLLLIHGHDPARPEAGWYWFTPGGGLEPGESLVEGAVREVREETGLELHPDALGAVVGESTVEFGFDGYVIRQYQRFFVVRVEHFEPDTTGWEPGEVRAQGEVRWWGVEEIEATDEAVYPEDLLDLLRAAA